MGISLIAVAVAAIWVYLIGFRGRFWSTRERLPPAEAAPPRSVVVVIPARNEAQVIGRALLSLAVQDYLGPLHIVVVDDHSSDGTAAAARSAMAAAGAASQLTIVAASPVPQGWTGKLWAMRQGVDAARRFQPDYLLLTDADIVHGRTSLRDLVGHAEAAGHNLVSLMVRLRCDTVWERLLIPPFVFFFFMLYPPRWVTEPRRRTAAAAGGCMLVRPEALDRVGGIDSIRHELIDDCALARRIKSVGTIWLGATDDTHSIREYGSWRPIWDMIARCAFAQLGYSANVLAATATAMVATYIAPPLLLLSGDGWAAALGAAAWLAMSCAFVPILRLYNCSVGWALALPVAALFYMAATIASAVQFWRGRGGAWKGRFQPPSSTSKSFGSG